MDSLGWHAHSRLTTTVIIAAVYLTMVATVEPSMAEEAVPAPAILAAWIERGDEYRGATRRIKMIVPRERVRYGHERA